MGSLRLLLALAVVAAHAGPAGGWTWLEMTGGPLAVQVFYVFSGFYMALVLHEKYVGDGAYVAFARSRLLRLFPMYLVVLAATLGAAVVLHALLGVTLEPLAQWRTHGPQMPWTDRLALAAVHGTIVGQDVVTFAAIDPDAHALYFTPDFHREPLPAWRLLWVPQAWTVSLELMFYALAPLLVRRRPRTLVALVCASLVLRVALMRAFGVYHDPWTYRFFPTELALFLAGALAWQAHRALAGRRWLRPSLCWAATAGLATLIVGYQLLPPALHTSRYGLAALLAIVPVLLPFVFEATRAWRLDRALGELSYPVYLVHYLPVFVVAALGVPWLTAASGIVVLVTSLALAIVLWRCVGLPLEARRHRLRPGAAVVARASRAAT